MSKKALVAVADGVEEIEAVAVVDVLRRAGVDVSVAAVSRQRVNGSRGVVLIADTTIDQCVDVRYDLVVLPGGMPGAELLRDSAVLADLLRRHAAGGGLYAAICASPVVVLQHYGLLAGRKATCHPAFAEKLENTTSIKSRVVVDGNCVTSRGPGTAIEFGLKLVELLYDKPKADDIAEAMVVK